MVASGRLPKESSDINEDRVSCGMFSEGVLVPQKVSQLQEEYKKVVPDYAKVLEEYQKAANKLVIVVSSPFFPGKDTWNPPGRTLSVLERQLLKGL